MSGMYDGIPRTGKGFPDPPRWKEPKRRADGVPLPKDQQGLNWRDTERLTFGERLLRELDPESGTLTHDQHRKICAIDNGEAISALLSADLGDAMCPDLRRAAEVFGKLEEEGLNLPDTTFALRFYALAQLMLNIEDGRQMLRGKLKAKERLEALRLCQQATEEFTKLVNYVQTLAIRMNRMEVPAPVVAEPVATEPRAPMVAPDLE